MAKSQELHFDYVIVGGGLCGCVIASRLSQKHPSLSVALIEAGPEDSHNPKVLTPSLATTLKRTHLVYPMRSVPQTHLDGRTVEIFGGRILSGSSAVNYGCWTRGHAADFDRWAHLVGDERWSYKGLLPYFKRSEHHHDLTADASQHGFEGPIHTSCIDRGYPLKGPHRNALLESGLEFVTDINAGNPNGFARFHENWHNVSREHAALRYNMDKVQIFTESIVARITIGTDPESGKQKAYDAELVNGSRFVARKEVLVCCGAIRTPQILLLSGIGPSQELSRHGIDQKMELPVGRNLHDHPLVGDIWKLKHPEQGLAIGAPTFNKPAYITGNPIDWMVTQRAKDEELEAAALIDGDELVSDRGADFEIACMYAAATSEATSSVPLDGSHISNSIIGLSTTSRGNVTLASTDVQDTPLIDPQFCSTAHDKAILRAGLRLSARIMRASSLNEVIEGRVPPPGLPTTDDNESDAALDAKIRTAAASCAHYAGTAAMGSVVDTKCRVLGVDNLRVVDASIMPLSITAHLQASLYAIAESAADLISDSEK